MEEQGEKGLVGTMKEIYIEVEWVEEKINYNIIRGTWINDGC